MTDFLFRESFAELDPAVFELNQIEEERQKRKLILIASESSAPLAVRQASSSVFQNIYAEGYPREDTRLMDEEEILDYPARLGIYRRYADPRYYKGVEYVDLLEALARRRCAELFAANGFSADRIFVNVQALSGGPANNAVYHALLSPGDTIMGMDLTHGGHLSHGAVINRSGKLYRSVPYTVDAKTERIDYDAVEALARQHKPKLIIAGYSSYPWQVDWARFRAIADAVGAYLFADIAHVAGLVAADVYPSPLGHAHVIAFTTHKSLCGPRAACIVTTDAALSQEIDRAVFPGEQGGPHVHVFAAMAVTFKLAQTEKFRQLQRQVVANAAVLAHRLAERGLRIPGGGTDTHLLNVDCSCCRSEAGTTLSGDQAARILDLAGIVVNRNTLPGDLYAADPSGIRLGTVWVTQRGLREAEMITLADIIADVLLSAKPCCWEGHDRLIRRAKIDSQVLQAARLRVRALAEKAAHEGTSSGRGYPHFIYPDDRPPGDWAVYRLRGEKVREFVNYAFSSDVESLDVGFSQPTRLYSPQGEVNGFLTCQGQYDFRFSLRADQAGEAITWLRDLSDGYVIVDDQDVRRKVPGPIVIEQVQSAPVTQAVGEVIHAYKPYFVHIPALAGEPLPAFTWQEQEADLKQASLKQASLHRTPIYAVHRQLGAKMIPFAGWEMPVWYTSVMEEHLAVRQAAGLFDVTHMGVYQAEGAQAAVFLDSVVGNDIAGLPVGQSCYTHFLDPDANVIDDLLVYRRGKEKFLIVVNASNDDKDWAWLNAVRQQRVQVDRLHPWVHAYGNGVILRNLRDPQEGADMRIDVALQGPRSSDVLLSLGCDAETRRMILALKRTGLCEAVVGGFDLVVSCTGYTGEKLAYELFVHPDRAAELFQALLEAGKPFGLKPCGLGARDSLRTEAGLPLYGHEMGGDLALGVGEAGFGSYVKAYKPWFIGRQAFLEREERRKGVVVRFRFNEKGVRMAHLHDPVLDKHGRVVGMVTSCAVGKEGCLIGQAYVDLKSAEEGMQLFIFQSAPKEAGQAPANLKIGDRKDLPTPATVISRFL